ncbi:hypothetical protein BGLA2_1320007 [Burkholderia gladioli]|nr:hypothetical protein BGLA2_1320007 [Burkholderia gladioli]
MRPAPFSLHAHRLAPLARRENRLAAPTSEGVRNPAGSPVSRRVDRVSHIPAKLEGLTPEHAIWADYGAFQAASLGTRMTVESGINPENGFFTTAPKPPTNSP